MAGPEFNVSQNKDFSAIIRPFLSILFFFSLLPDQMMEACSTSVASLARSGLVPFRRRRVAGETLRNHMLAWALHLQHRQISRSVPSGAKGTGEEGSF